MKKINVYVFRACLLFSFCLWTSCKKFLEIPPPVNQLVSSSVFENEASANAALVGIYSEMMNNAQQFSSGYVTFFAGMAADELYFYTPGYRDEFVQNKITLINHDFISSAFWNPMYRYIYSANLCIESLEKSTALSPETKRKLSAEAKFIRAFCYYYLVNLFGEVPLIISADFNGNAEAPRTQTILVWEQITKDLEDAANDLPFAYLKPERTRPIKWAAAALLSRVYLHGENWSSAEKNSEEVINSGLYNLVTDLNAVFLKNSKEAIWQLQPVNPTYNTWEGYAILGGGTAEPSYLLTPALVNSFSAGDKRKEDWTDQRSFSGDTVTYPYKYKVPRGNGAPATEFYMVLRYAEQYLIRAEARAQQNKIFDGLADVNSIRRRAGLSDTTAGDKATLLAIVEKERQAELFAEWGHRWFDLKRTGRADALLSPLKPSWIPTAKLWPIPINQIYLNSAITQNPGY